MLTLSQLQAIMPRLPAEKATEYIPYLNAAMEDLRDLLKIAAEETGIPLLEVSNAFWWAPARGETWHPTAKEFLRVVVASR